MGFSDRWVELDRRKEAFGILGVVGEDSELNLTSPRASSMRLPISTVISRAKSSHWHA